MRIGMLWFDNEPKKSTADKVLGAARYYHQKYGATATLAYVHPNMGKAEIEGITVKFSKEILPNHVWIGVEKQDG